MEPLPSPPASSSSSHAATLRSLYNRAAKAFLHRDVLLTQTLLSEAFAILTPPAASQPDLLADHRRKWDILRITHQTTLYASPPPADKLPPDLRQLLVQSSPSLITSFYARSLTLFTPTQGHKPDATFLPSQVLVTLVYSSLKLDCPDVGRTMIEDWLARYGIIDFNSDPAVEHQDGYDQVIDLYCLHVLPRLDEWDYAAEFLDYENELPAERRASIRQSLKTLHSQHLESRSRPKHQHRSSKSPPRSSSPAPSASSTSSSLSTTSTHTAVPSTPRPAYMANSHYPFSRPPLPRRSSAASRSSSSASTSTATPRRNRSSQPSSRHPSSSSRTTDSQSSTHPFGVGSHHPNTLPVSLRPPSTYTLIKASILPYLTTPRLSTFILLFIIFPLLSLFLRIRVRRKAANGNGNQLAADLVRRRLHEVERTGLVRWIWREAIRAIVDTIKMGGSGLV